MLDYLVDGELPALKAPTSRPQSFTRTGCAGWEGCEERNPSRGNSCCLRAIQLSIQLLEANSCQMYRGNDIQR